MISRSRYYPIMVAAFGPDLGDLLVVCERAGITLGEALTEALHIGAASVVDKWEAEFSARRSLYPYPTEAAQDTAELVGKTFTYPVVALAALTMLKRWSEDNEAA